MHALGGDPTKVRFTIAYNASRQPDGTVVAGPKKGGLKCQLDYPFPGQFEPGVEEESVGLWDELGY